MLLNDYPVTLKKYKVYPILGSIKVRVYTICEGCIPKFIDKLDPNLAYNFERLIDYGSCSVCHIHTVKKHIYIKSMSKKKGK